MQLPHCRTNKEGIEIETNYSCCTPSRGPVPTLRTTIHVVDICLKPDQQQLQNSSFSNLRFSSSIQFVPKFQHVVPTFSYCLLVLEFPVHFRGNFKRWQTFRFFLEVHGCLFTVRALCFQIFDTTNPIFVPGAAFFSGTRAVLKRRSDEDMVTSYCKFTLEDPCVY